MPGIVLPKRSSAFVYARSLASTQDIFDGYLTGEFSRFGLVFKINKNNYLLALPRGIEPLFSP